MKQSLWLSLMLAMTACGSHSEALPTVDELAADPVRLKELRQQCRLERAKLGDEMCMRVAEATRKRFLGDGEVPYTPPKEPPKF